MKDDYKRGGKNMYKSKRRMKEIDMTMMDGEPYNIHTSSTKVKQVGVATSG
jgi:hypothetical protein